MLISISSVKLSIVKFISFATDPSDIFIFPDKQIADDFPYKNILIISLNLNEKYSRLHYI